MPNPWHPNTKPLPLPIGVTTQNNGLEQVKTTLRSHFEIVDWQGVEIIMATAAAHYILGEMLWLRFIGPSRSGRTELLRAIAEHPDCVEIEVLTPAAIRGGYKKGPKLLDCIDRKLVITKDIAAILPVRRDLKNEVFGLLRGAKDGKLTADFGSDEGHLEQEARFDWILAATSTGIEQQRPLESLLGQRFVDLRWHPGDREEMAYRAACNNPHLSDIRVELVVDVASLLVRAKKEAQTLDDPLSESDRRWIARAADKTALLRTSITRNRQAVVTSLPEPEFGTDLSQGFSRIASGLLLLGIDDWVPHIRRLLWDCMPSVRAAILQRLADRPQTSVELQHEMKMPLRTLQYHLEELAMLSIIRLITPASNVEQVRELFISILTSYNDVVDCTQSSPAQSIPYL